MPDERRQSAISQIALIASNSIPLFGVIFLHWQVFPIILIYWLENVVVGGFNVLRMLVADPDNPAVWIGKLFLIPFFCFHFGMFTAVHGTFVFAIFDRGTIATSHSMFPTFATVSAAVRHFGIGFAVLALVVSHAASFVWNYILGGEYRRASIAVLMSQPYSRVVVLHVAILGGGILVQALHSPVPALVVLIGAKVWIDLAAHRRERAKLALPAMPGASADPEVSQP